MTVKAIQQFQLRQELTSDAKAREVLRKVSEAGFTGIELCGFMIDRLPLGIRLLAKMAGYSIGSGGKMDWADLIQSSALSVVAIHEGLEGILNDTDRIVERAHSFKTDTIVVPGLRRFDFSDKSAVIGLAEQLNEAGQILQSSGLNLLYHNHNAELTRLKSECALDILLEQTDENYVNFEYDSYWPAEAGCDPLQLMHRIGARMKLYHINDRGFYGGRQATAMVKSSSMALGCGNMRLDDLVAAAKGYGVKAIILESHDNWIDHSAVKSMAVSSIFMNANI